MTGDFAPKLDSLTNDAARHGPASAIRSHGQRNGSRGECRDHRIQLQESALPDRA